MGPCIGRHTASSHQAPWMPWKPELCEINVAAPPTPPSRDCFGINSGALGNRICQGDNCYQYGGYCDDGPVSDECSAQHGHDRLQFGSDVVEIRALGLSQLPPLDERFVCLATRSGRPASSNPEPTFDNTLFGQWRQGFQPGFPRGALPKALQTNWIGC